MSAVAGLQGGARLRPALRPAAVLAVASASSFLVYLDATIVNVAFPDIRASFSGATLAGLSWILSAYGLVFAALLVPGGRYADVVGGRRLFLAGLAAFTRGLGAVRDGALGAAARGGARAAGGRRRAARPLLAAARDGGVPAGAADEGHRRDGGRRRARLRARAGARRADGRPRRLAARVPRQPPDRPRGARARAGGCPRRPRGRWCSRPDLLGLAARGGGGRDARARRRAGPGVGLGRSAHDRRRSSPPRCSRRCSSGAARGIRRRCSSCRCSAAARSARATSARCCSARASSGSCSRTRST